MLNNLERIKQFKPDNKKYVLLTSEYEEYDSYKQYEAKIDFENAIDIFVNHDIMTLVPYFENCENIDLTEYVIV